MLLYFFPIGKGVNIWDTFCHDERLCSGHNGDVACDSYNLWERDIEMVQELEVLEFVCDLDLITSIQVSSFLQP